jgi:hypothetical protein
MNCEPCCIAVCQVTERLCGCACNMRRIWWRSQNDGGGGDCCFAGRPHHAALRDSRLFGETSCLSFSGHKKFYPENEGRGILRKVYRFLPNCAALRPQNGASRILRIEYKFLPNCTALHPQYNCLYNALVSPAGLPLLLGRQDVVILDFFALNHDLNSPSHPLLHFSLALSLSLSLSPPPPAARVYVVG